MEEKWKFIEGYEGIYKVSNIGRIRSLSRKNSLGSLRKERILKPSLSNNGYKVVFLYKNSIPKPHRIHRLVAKHFIKNIKNKPCVNHKDCNKLNNKSINLEWVTFKENIQHSWKNGRNIYPKGELNGISKLTEKQVRYIRKIGKSKTLAEMGDKFGVTFQTISDIINRKTWKHIK